LTVWHEKPSCTGDRRLPSLAYRKSISRELMDRPVRNQIVRDAFAVLMGSRNRFQRLCRRAYRLRVDAVTFTVRLMSGRRFPRLMAASV